MLQTQNLKCSSRHVTTAETKHKIVNSKEGTTKLLKTTKVELAKTITTRVFKQTLTLRTKMPKTAMLTIHTIEITGNRKLSTHLVRPVAKATTPQ